MPAHRPLRARAANRAAWTSLSTPAGANGTSSAGANSTARDTRTTTANAPRERGPCIWNAARMDRSEPVEVGFAVRPDHGQARRLAEEFGRDRAHPLLVDGVEPVEHLAHRQVLAVGELALAE